MLRKMDCGVYMIQNKIDGHCYIGSSKELYRRLNVHKKSLQANSHGNMHLQSAWNKYGEDNFNFSILCFCDPQTRLIYEQTLLDKFRPEYNNISDVINNSGNHWSDEAKAKRSAMLTGVKRSAETCKSISLAKSGEGHHLCKLSDAEVYFLRQIWEHRDKSLTQTKLAKVYGLNQRYVGRLIHYARRPECHI